MSPCSAVAYCTPSGFALHDNRIGGWLPVDSRKERWYQLLGAVRWVIPRADPTWKHPADGTSLHEMLDRILDLDEEDQLSDLDEDQQSDGGA